eukprot:CAMPEP_0198729478 /NCGR_PEP_ID=MMETSP1475-20131203/18711_1 /TAXON_ID= ORGANISM="Unidentified sp., Strain CCMP1999" /NCGR_SAMPLE_ID=MMETSP1475 /ASSEMBLY_ACC=CAM_ASM_001111 /LENGTH=397 /DNA_ID=CAMNT_0044492139 /DNA_START=130 /DNA_END=1323 /DNA_ORIENTATION=+
MAAGFVPGPIWSQRRRRVPSRERRPENAQVVACQVADDSEKRDTSIEFQEGRRSPLQQIPVVATPEEHLSRAFKVAERASLDVRTKRGKSPGEIHRLATMKKIETLREELAGRLKGYEAKFPRKSNFHPYEDALADLTLCSVNLDKYGGYQGVLDSIGTLRKKLNAQGKAHASTARQATNRKEVDKAKRVAFMELENIYKKDAVAVERLKLMAKTLHGLQTADITLPTVVLTGAPNVGKSSIVRLYSSGIPEVCAYPFTTKKIVMGHFLDRGRKYQMTDTPGLLNRAENQRNIIEKLTIAALQHLRSLVLFVVDLTEDCGMSVTDQLELRHSLRSRFLRDGQPWIDVLSKSDLRSSFKHEDLYRQCVSNYWLLSAESGEGVEELKEEFITGLSNAFD